MKTVKSMRKKLGLPDDFIPQQRTPEEIERARTEGQQSIREREKLASRAGISSKAAAEKLIGQREGLIAAQPENLAATELEEQSRYQADVERLLSGEIAKQGGVALGKMGVGRGGTIDGQAGDGGGVPTQEFIPTSAQLEATAGKKVVGIPQRTAEEMWGRGKPATFTEWGDQWRANQRTALKGTLNLASEIFDNMRTILFGRDTVAVKDARQVFSQATASIQDDINDVLAGNLSPGQAISNLELAWIANCKLERQVKTINLENFKYFVRDGADIEAEVLLNKQELERLRNSLKRAVEARIQQQQVSSARTTIGLK